MMKLCCAIILFALLSAPMTLGETEDLVEKRLVELRETCLKETQVDQELIEKASKGDFADDEKLKCYTKCLFAQQNLISDEGIIDVEGFAKYLEPHFPDMVPVVKKCGTKTGKDACENAWLTHQCYQKEYPKYFLP